MIEQLLKVQDKNMYFETLLSKWDTDYLTEKYQSEMKEVFQRIEEMEVRELT